MLNFTEVNKYIKNEFPQPWKYQVCDLGEGLIQISVEDGCNLATLIRLLVIIKKENSKTHKMTAMIPDERKTANAGKCGDWFDGLYANFEEK